MLALALGGATGSARGAVVVDATSFEELARSSPGHDGRSVRGHPRAGSSPTWRSPDGSELAVADVLAVRAVDPVEGTSRLLHRPAWPDGPGCPILWRSAELGGDPLPAS